jgi:hypothetical protein
MKSLRIWIAAAIGLALLVPSAALSVRSANSASYVDPAGDSGTAPDLTSATVANDDQGIVTFSIGIGNRDQLGETDYVQVIANIDGSDGTGVNGFDLVLQVEGTDTALFMFRDSEWARYDAPSLHSSYAAGLMTITIGMFDLRAIGDFDFRLHSGIDHGGAGKEDAVPDNGAVDGYTIKVPLLLDELDAPSTVKAGKTLDVSMTLVTDSESEGVVTCSAKIGSTKVPGTPGWMNILILPPKDPNGGITISTSIGYEGFALCSFKVPKNAKGKVINATIKATRAGVVVSRTVSARVR